MAPELRSYAKKQPERLIQRLLKSNQGDLSERPHSQSSRSFWRRTSMNTQKEPSSRFTDISKIEQQHQQTELALFAER